MSRFRSIWTAFGTVTWWDGGDISPVVLTAVNTWKFDHELHHLVINDIYMFCAHQSHPKERLKTLWCRSQA